MPSIAKSKQWFIRVDYPLEHMKAKLAVVENWVDTSKTLAAYHVGEKGENPHFHLCLTLSSELQKQSVDVRFKNLFGWTKGSDYSSKPWDGVYQSAGAASYLFHEADAIVVSNKGYSEDDLNKLKEYSLKVQEVVAVNKERGTKRAVQRIIDKVGIDAGHSKIAHVMMKEIRDGEMYHPGGFRFATVVEEVYVKCLSKDAFDNYSSWYVNKVCNDNKWYD